MRDRVYCLGWDLAVDQSHFIGFISPLSQTPLVSWAADLLGGLELMPTRPTFSPPLTIGR